MAATPAKGNDMRKIRRFNGEDGSEVSDEDLNKMRQDQTDRMARIVNSSESSSRETPAATPVAAAPKAKPAIVTKEQLQAFKTKYGADKDLTDYMNKQQGLVRRKPATPPKTVAPEVKKSEEPPVKKSQPAVSETRTPKRARNLTDMLGITTPYKSGGSVSAASKRGDGCATKGKTKGRMI